MVASLSSGPGSCLEIVAQPMRVSVWCVPTVVVMCLEPMEKPQQGTNPHRAS